MPAPTKHIPGKHISNAGFMNDMANLLKNSKSGLELLNSLPYDIAPFLITNNYYSILQIKVLAMYLPLLIEELENITELTNRRASITSNTEVYATTVNPAHTINRDTTTSMTMERDSIVDHVRTSKAERFLAKLKKTNDIINSAFAQQSVVAQNNSGSTRANTSSWNCGDCCDGFCCYYDGDTLIIANDGFVYVGTSSNSNNGGDNGDCCEPCVGCIQWSVESSIDAFKATWNAAFGLGQFCQDGFKDCYSVIQSISCPRVNLPNMPNVASHLPTTSNVTDLTRSLVESAPTVEMPEVPSCDCGSLDCSACGNIASGGLELAGNIIGGCGEACCSGGCECCSGCSGDNDVVSFIFGGIVFVVMGIYGLVTGSSADDDSENNRRTLMAMAGHAFDIFDESADQAAEQAHRQLFFDTTNSDLATDLIIAMAVLTAVTFLPNLLMSFARIGDNLQKNRAPRHDWMNLLTIMAGGALASMVTATKYGWITRSVYGVIAAYLSDRLFNTWLTPNNKAEMYYKLSGKRTMELRNAVVGSSTPVVVATPITEEPTLQANSKTDTGTNPLHKPGPEVITTATPIAPGTNMANSFTQEEFVRAVARIESESRTEYLEASKVDKSANALTRTALALYQSVRRGKVTDSADMNTLRHGTIEDAGAVLRSKIAEMRYNNI